MATIHPLKINNYPELEQAERLLKELKFPIEHKPITKRKLVPMLNLVLFKSRISLSAEIEFLIDLGFIIREANGDLNPTKSLIEYVNELEKRISDFKNGWKEVVKQ